jgi:hypothetical protein
MNRNLLAGSALLAALVGCRADAPKATPAQTDAARTFVVEFYNWYYPNSDSGKNIDTLMARRRSVLAPDLAALIDSDNACMARTHGECNLEEDPILAAQDPCERYEVGGTATHGGTVGVAIFAVCSGKRDTIPSVIAVVAPVDSGWQFVNFVYPAERTDLRHILGRKTHP